MFWKKLFFCVSVGLLLVFVQYANVEFLPLRRRARDGMKNKEPSSNKSSKANNILTSNVHCDLLSIFVICQCPTRCSTFLLTYISQVVCRHLLSARQRGFVHTRTFHLNIDNKSDFWNAHSVKILQLKGLIYDIPPWTIIFLPLLSATKLMHFPTFHNFVWTF